MKIDISIKRLMNDCKAVLIDMDGVITDTARIWPEIDKAVLESYGISYQEGFCENLKSKNHAEATKAIYDHFEMSDITTVEELTHRIHDKAVVTYAECKLKPGITQFMFYCKTKSIPVIVCTCAISDFVRLAIYTHELSKYITGIMTADESGLNKHTPEIWQRAALMAHQKPERCIVFEDLPGGLSSARDAGCRTVNMLDSFSKQFEEEKARIADITLASFLDIRY